jgi:hypothetical protein
MMLFSKTPIISFLCSARVFAAVDYAVYFDPSEDSRNPLQRAGLNMIYKPYAPSLWNKVDSVSHLRCKRLIEIRKTNRNAPFIRTRGLFLATGGKYWMKQAPDTLKVIVKVMNVKTA